MASLLPGRATWSGERHSVLVDAATGEPVPRLSYTTPEGRQVQGRQTRVRKVGE
jgi:hypothetical protein